MKYYVYRFYKNSGFVFKRTKCNDYWTHNYNLCWQFSKQGASEIVNRLNSRRKNDLYEYGMIEVDKVDEMIHEYLMEMDRETYMAEEANYRPYWI